LQKWPVNASAQGKGLWRQFGRATKTAICEVNKEDGQKGLDESLRNGEGTIGLQGRHMGWVLEGFERFFGGTGGTLGGCYLHPWKRQSAD